MIKYAGKKLTPVELAKFLVCSDGDNADYWEERYEDVVSAMTLRERAAVSDQIMKQQNRVRKLFNIAPIMEKIYGNA